MVELCSVVGARPYGSARKNEPIMVGSARGNIDIVNRLLDDPRVDPSDQNNDAIVRAISHRHPRIINRLLEDPRVSNPMYIYR